MNLLECNARLAAEVDRKQEIHFNDRDKDRVSNNTESQFTLDELSRAQAYTMQGFCLDRERNANPFGLFQENYNH